MLTEFTQGKRDDASNLPTICSLFATSSRSPWINSLMHAAAEVVKKYFTNMVIKVSERKYYFERLRPYVSRFSLVGQLQKRSGRVFHDPHKLSS